MKMASLEGIKASAGPLSLGFSGISSTLCGEVANFACKFQSISSSEASQDISKGSDSSFPTPLFLPSLHLSIILAHILLLAPAYQLDKSMKFIHPFAYALHMHSVPSVLVQPTPALVSTT